MDKQSKSIDIWDKVYLDYEDGSVGIEYPHEELVRFVSNLRKTMSVEDYFNDKGKEKSLKENFIGNALEFGFGHLANLRMLRKKGFKVYGLEVSEESVKRCKKELKERKTDDIFIQLWTPPLIPFTDNFFSLLTGAQCIYYNLDLEKVIKECHRTLKEDGSFIFSFFSTRHDYMKYAIQEGRYTKWSDNHPNPRLRGAHLRQPKSKEELMDWFKIFKDLRIFTWETDQLPMFQSWWNITGKR